MKTRHLSPTRFMPPSLCRVPWYVLGLLVLSLWVLAACGGNDANADAGAHTHPATYRGCCGNAARR